ncbi:MAG: hypothetical protein IJF90_01140 [Synergistaceae bacterium]|nr:hypothetical protein [Synergistaceae bacterium]
MGMFIIRVKHYSRDIMDMLCVIGSCLLGRCSFRKTKAYIHEAVRYKLSSRATKKGKPSIITHFDGKKIMNTDEANAFLGRAIEAGEPFMAGRFGTIELETMWRTRDDGKGFITPIDSFMQLFCHSTVFFPNDKQQMIKFSQLMRDSTKDIDFMAMHHFPMCEYEAAFYGPKHLQYCEFTAIEPFFAREAWTVKLEGKRVLVIHPFDKSIPAQFAKRDLLFPGKNILPEFELIMQKSVQTMCYNKDERFSDWFEALNYMYTEAMKKDFDVALIGCGAYGFPLAAMLKRAGKIAVHLGAVVQLIFGIRGRRWENASQEYRDMLSNPAWVRPDESEHPDGFQRHENAAYW